MTEYLIPSATKQIFVAKRYNEMKDTHLHSALAVAAANVDPKKLRAQIIKYVPSNAALARLSKVGVRDEEAFATPIILEHNPRLLAYYRLLLGISRKQFYEAKTSNTEAFVHMEDDGTVPANLKTELPGLCRALNKRASELVLSLPSNKCLAEDIRYLPILQLGSQYDGAWRVEIGKTATNQVFDVIEKIILSTGIKPKKPNGSLLVVTNSSGRDVVIELAADPDITIREIIAGLPQYKVAIEIKRGTDRANVHNRAGEAEKSHQNAQRDGAAVCWTIINMAGVDKNRLCKESPTTHLWLDYAELISNSGTSWVAFKNALLSALGI